MSSLRSFFTWLLLLTAVSGCGQDFKTFTPQTDSITLPLGDTSFTVVRYRYDTVAQPFIIHIHHNEQTADTATRIFLEKNGGVYVTLINNRNRLLTFSVGGNRYTIDPNRMFTPRGRRQSLEVLGTYAAEADSAAAVFAGAFLALLPPDGPATAVHNNTPGHYSMASYEGGGAYAKEAAAIFNAQTDKDDFVLTTDKAVFALMQKQGINTVLLNKDAAVDDGSLGFYFGKTGRSYTNVEAEHGHFAAQLKMLSLLHK